MSLGETLLADLMWAINSPSLAHVGEAYIQPTQITVSEVDLDELVAFVGTPPLRVGRYFERLVAFYLTKIRGVDVIAQQRQIVLDGRTLGEIDYLFRDESGQLVHLETAVKFYLHLPGQPHNGSHLVGPNANDSFQKKMDRLSDHQLKLTDHAPDLVAGEPLLRMAMVKGRIYYHLDHESERAMAPGLTSDHLHGSWFRAKAWSTDRCAERSHFCLMSKPHWLSPDSAGEPLNLDVFTELVQERFATSDRPIHGCFNGDPNLCFFVVSNNWPNQSPKQ